MLSKRSKARIIRMLVILGVVLALAVTGIVIAVNQLLAGQKAQNGMPENGVIFSDGMEQDYIAFNSGSVVTIGIADQKGDLVI